MAKLGTETRMVLALCAAVALAVFVFDLLTPLGVAAAVPYVALVLLALWLPWTRAPLVLAGIAIILTILGGVLSAPEGQLPVVLTNRSLAIFVVIVTSWLTYAHHKEWRAQRENEARWRVITDTAIDGIIVIDDRGIIQMVNPAFEAMFGYSAAELLERNVTMLMRSPDRERHDGYIGHYLETGERHVIGIGREVMALRKDGTPIPVRLAVGEARVSGRRLFTGFVHDLTETKLAEQKVRALQSELYRTSRLGELGEMAAAIAHEINQPLTAVRNYLGALRREVHRGGGHVPEKVDEIMSKAGRQAERASEVVRNIRQLARGGETARTGESLNDVVEEAVALGLIGAHEKGIKTTVSLAEDLPPCSMNRIQIQQVILNLLRNSVDALATCERRELAVRTISTNDGHVEVAVEDSGPGLPKHVSERLFQRFVTTKQNGMGIGLSISYSIVTAHDGRLWAQPREGGGTVFRFALPIVGDDASIPSERAADCLHAPG